MPKIPLEARKIWDQLGREQRFIDIVVVGTGPNIRTHRGNGICQANCELAHQGEAHGDVRRRAARAPLFPPGSTNGSGGTRVGTINEYLCVSDDGGNRVVRCRCGAVLGDATDDFHAGLAVRELTATADVLGAARSAEVPAYTIREHFCPACWTLVDTDIFVARTMP